MLSPSPRHQQIYDLVQQIPWGQVATYGQVADLIGWPGRARQVGYALFRIAPDSPIPWHRVVNARGEISCAPSRQGSDDLQRIRLEAEDIVFNAQGRLDLQRYGWHGPDQASPLSSPGIC
ncbi:MGMT family protein [Lyngbya confervoides]|uniref:MGMT family protein n=1 Tax=Lyngbya confervoides BDU141951 TaxID=1574623 RepID=A0ABD4T9E5_9CYAN|nr:MGMT family protein [Lyngbya confervoides]MCM1985231.1 MGMT family protein [Lyngbya confervoides BDU141951]